ncbi:hypothetical protein QBC33DRAFT_62441 [Phialemonium atrogriseum]|uniref:Secreted protein n=1 Tax=Phialemonium atrogriseum TaxID=1093897 RepID=A0AAJ0C0Y8_9PEZI|nr:uncharacterized protein QBC33DRAFT_62441 [Phialemonium atrogriseum]KAK1767935.1 hypothetical protein QBC33DRAFT_62441 [Phialemonium atrogriseum]
MSLFFLFIFFSVRARLFIPPSFATPTIKQKDVNFPFQKHRYVQNAVLALGQSGTALSQSEQIEICIIPCHC